MTINRSNWAEHLSVTKHQHEHQTSGVSSDLLFYILQRGKSATFTCHHSCLDNHFPSGHSVPAHPSPSIPTSSSSPSLLSAKCNGHVMQDVYQV